MGLENDGVGLENDGVWWRMRVWGWRMRVFAGNYGGCWKTMVVCWVSVYQTEGVTKRV